MACFPLSMELAGRTVLLAGRGPLCEEKLHKLLPFGPRITLFSSGGQEEWEAHPRITVVPGPLTEGHLTPPPAFVMTAGLSREESRSIGELCFSRGIPFNAADQPELCSVFLPAMVVRGDCVVSVSTGGRSPGLASALCRRLEEQLPGELEELVDWAAELRKELKKSISDSERRKAVLRSAISRALERGGVLSEEEMKSLF